MRVPPLQSKIQSLAGSRALSNSALTWGIQRRKFFQSTTIYNLIVLLQIKVT